MRNRTYRIASLRFGPRARSYQLRALTFSVTCSEPIYPDTTLRSQKGRLAGVAVSRPPRGPFHRHGGENYAATRIRYALNSWVELTRFLDDARIPPDNNRSESALRVVALGRKNFLFVGHEEAGDNIAGLYSLTATCDANGVEPIAYLTDVLGRIGSHPAAALNDLLPHKWRQSG